MTEDLPTPTRCRSAACTLAVLAALLPWQAPRADELRLSLDGITRDGTVHVAVYAGKAQYQKEPARQAQVDARAGQVAVLNLDGLMPGEYAVSAFLDLDGNGRLNTNLLGMPSEPWATSRQGSSVFGAPSWEDTRFMLKPGRTTMLMKFSQ